LASRKTACARPAKAKVNHTIKAGAPRLPARTDRPIIDSSQASRSSAAGMPAWTATSRYSLCGVLLSASTVPGVMRSSHSVVQLPRPWPVTGRSRTIAAVRSSMRARCPQLVATASLGV